MVSCIKGGKQTKGICKQDPEVKIWAQEDERGDWRRLHNEEYIFYRSPTIVRVIKSRKLRWVGDVARMEGGRSAFKILTDKPTG